LLLFASRPATAAPAVLFAEDWRAHVTPLASVAAPQPSIQTQGELTAAIGASQATMEGQGVAISFVTLVGRGRALSILGVANTKEILAQQGAFFDSLDAAPAAAAPAPAPRPAAAEVEVDLEAPPGYAVERNPGAVLLKPK